MPLAAL